VVRKYKEYLKETKIFSCLSLQRVLRLIYDVDPEVIQEAAVVATTIGTFSDII
jgi:hypothetical protein